MRLDPRELDRRLVPWAAAALHGALDRLAVQRRRAAGAARRAGTAGVSVLAGASGRLDARYAARGPLALLRDVPQLALLLVAAVFVSGALAAALLREPASGPARQAGAPAAERVRLGAPPGSDADAYLRAAATVLRAAAADSPDRTRLALVSLRRFLPVGELPDLLGGTRAQRVYLRAPDVDGAEELAVPLGDPDTGRILPALCTATATRKRGEAAELRRVAATIEATTPEEALQRDDFVAQADRTDREAAAFDGACATAYAVVVEGRLEQLAALLTRPEVRGVEVGPAGRPVLEVQVEPLLPTTTTVPGA